MTDKREGGYIDHAPFATALSAHVTTPDARQRIRGYDAQSDLARHYSPLETGVLALLGELPSTDQVEMLELAMSLCSPLHAGEGPCRSATLAWLTGGNGLAAIRVGWLALVDRARNELLEREPLSRALAAEDLEAFGSTHKASGELDAWVVEEFSGRCPALKLGLDRISAAIALFAAGGIFKHEQLVLLMCMARMPTVLGEADAGRKGGFVGQPGNLPVFPYEAPERDDDAT